MRRLWLIGCTLLLVFPLGLLADSVSPYNTGSANIGAPAPGEESVQQISDQIYGANAINANTDQQMAGEWGVGTLPVTIGLTMVAEYAGFASSNTFGIWSGTNSSDLRMVDIFSGSASAGCMATMSFSGDGTLSIGAAGCGNNPSSINIGTFTGINPESFGFFLQGPGTTSGLDNSFFTANSLNPGGNSQAVSYAGKGGATSIFFEDLPFKNGSSDFNDQVVKIASLDPATTSVPEPSTLLLLGSGLLGLCGIARLQRKHV